jgi:hypothetical protein
MPHLLKSITKVFSTVTAVAFAATIFPLSASAVTIQYTDEATFTSNTSATYLETFDAPMSGALSGPQTFSRNGFAYTISAPNGLWSGNVNSPIGTQREEDDITISFTSGNVTALGGNFFLNDVADNLMAGIITLTLNDGSLINLNSPISGPLPFGGFTTDGSIITSLTISGPITTWENLDNLYVGTAITRVQPPASPTDVPEPFTVLGTIFGAGYGVALKRKLAKIQQGKTDIA